MGKTLPIEKKNLFVPPLEEIASVLRQGLQGNYSEVKVEVVDCPDLTIQPFTLAKKGLCGKTKLVEIGGSAFLIPIAQKNKFYDLKNIANIVMSDPAFIIGAGSGPHMYAKTNCEGIFNLCIDNGKIDQQSRIAKVDPADESNPVQTILPKSETRIGLQAHLFISDGNQGKVIKVHVRKRIGSYDFITSIRKSMESHYQAQPVGLGGAFLIEEGKVKHHVMRDFSKTPIKTEEQLNNWLKFYDFSAPLVGLGTVLSCDPGLGLRLQHFHTFSNHDQAGHYHIDVTPDIAEYLGFFSVAQEIYRIDRPVKNK